MLYRGIVFNIKKTASIAAMLSLFLYAVCGAGWIVNAKAAGYLEFESNSAAAIFGGGEGTTENPYLIYTAEQLNNIRNYTEGYSFKLAADIDISEFIDGKEPEHEYDYSTTNNLYGFLPIGAESSEAFGGVFDGGGHMIKGLWSYGRSVAGLFGYTYLALIKNLTVETDVRGVTGTVEPTTGQIGTGIIAGHAEESQIVNCAVSGQVSGMLNTGGIAGYMSGNSYALKCLSSAEIVSYGAGAGGIAGCAEYSVIKDCYVTGSITCKNLSDYEVNVHYYTGGIVGEFYGNEISKCCFTGRIRGEGLYYGGLAGLFEKAADTADRISSSYFCIDDNGELTAVGNLPDQYAGSVKTGQELKDPKLYSGWDFTDIWGFNESGTLVLRAFHNGAYFSDDPVTGVPQPYSYTWIWVTLTVIAVLLIAIAFIIILNKRKTANLSLKKDVQASPQPKRPMPESLTERELEIAQLIISGNTIDEMLGVLYISKNTLKTHIKNLLRKSDSTSQKDFILKYGMGVEKSVLRISK